jgi:hypothetical protein
VRFAERQRPHAHTQDGELDADKLPHSRRVTTTVVPHFMGGSNTAFTMRHQLSRVIAEGLRGCGICAPRPRCVREGGRTLMVSSTSAAAWAAHSRTTRTLSTTARAGTRRRVVDALLSARDEEGLVTIAERQCPHAQDGEWMRTSCLTQDGQANTRAALHERQQCSITERQQLSPVIAEGWRACGICAPRPRCVPEGGTTMMASSTSAAAWLSGSCRLQNAGTEARKHNTD